MDLKLIPFTVTFAGAALTEAPHGIANLSFAGQSVVDVAQLWRASQVSADALGGDSVTLSFSVLRTFASPVLAGVFALTHMRAMARGGALDLGAGATTVRMTGAARQNLQISGPFERNQVLVTYTFIGPPPAVI